jgi:uncharacterized membrane protein (DUF485 family)
MTDKSSNRSRLWLSLIAGAYVALALGAAFAPQWLNVHIGASPATRGLVLACGYLVFVIVVMAMASHPFSADGGDSES